MTDDPKLLRAEADYYHGEWQKAVAENEKLRDMLLRSDKLTRQEWYDMRNTQLAEEANAAAHRETDNDKVDG